jgi:hypothetical protein
MSPTEIVDVAGAALFLIGGVVGWWATRLKRSSFSNYWFWATRILSLFAVLVGFALVAAAFGY